MKNGSSVSSDFPVLVLGASAGGLLPLQEVLSAFPADLEVAVLIVQHIPAHAESHLAEILSTRCKLEVVQAEDGMVLRPGRVYTPVPDYHLLVDNDRVIIAKGPRENRFRPAIDALFRSSAYHYGSRVLGVVLSGALDDGTSGLYAIKRAGGVVLVQTPGEAAFRSMPDSAIDNVRVDYVLTAAEMGARITTICQSRQLAAQRVALMKKEKEFLDLEVGIAKGEDALAGGVLQYGKASNFACPECSGVLTEFREDSIVRYRCHTGHAHTLESLLSGVNDNIEDNLWKAMRGMEESLLLLEDIAERLARVGDTQRADKYLQRANRLKDRSQRVKRVIQAHQKPAASAFSEKS